MENFSNKYIKTLFSNLCCSKCKNDFTKDSLEIIEQDGDIIVCNLTCERCGKDFGQIIFNFNKKINQHTPLEIIEGPEPISYDDVIDAHEFLKKL